MTPSKKKVEFYRSGHSNMFVVHVLDAEQEMPVRTALELAGYVKISMVEDPGGIWEGEHEEVSIAFRKNGSLNAVFGSPDRWALECLCSAYRMIDGRDLFEVRRQFRP